MLSAPFVGLAYLLVTSPSFDLNTLPSDSCLWNIHYGAPGGKGIFLTHETCLDSLPNGVLLDEEVLLRARLPSSYEENGAKDLIWVEREAVEPKLLQTSQSNSFVPDELDTFLEHLKTSFTFESASNLNEQYSQHILQGQAATPVPHAELLVRGPTMGLISLSRPFTQPLASYAYDTLLPPHWRGTLLSLSSTQLASIPVPSSAIDRVKSVLKSVKFDPVVASLVNNISLPQMKNDIRFLTGEDGKSGIVSRHSFSDGIWTAAEWIRDRAEETGATCHFMEFLTGFGPNVICKYPGTTNTTETVLLSAHYDSRGSFGSTRAPGGDDDGSGSISILGIARTIARRKVTFKKNVELCWFAGEEQGLLGSRAYARELRNQGANLTLMVQADMLAYHAAGEPPQLGLPDIIGTTEVTQLVANLSAIYSPELTVGFTPACCSDHQSFHEQGFPASQVFERAGPIADPMYHNSGDLSDRIGYDFHQVKSIAKVQFATLLHTAGFDLGEDED